MTNLARHESSRHRRAAAAAPTQRQRTTANEIIPYIQDIQILNPDSVQHPYVLFSGRLVDDIIMYSGMHYYDAAAAAATSYYIYTYAYSDQLLTFVKAAATFEVFHVFICSGHLMHGSRGQRAIIFHVSRKSK